MKGLQFMTTAKELFAHAQKNHYAIPAFNIHNLETAKAVIEVAAELSSPLLLAATPGTISYAGLHNLLAITAANRKIYPVPIFFHLDHHEDIQAIKTGIEMGVHSVMIDASHHSFEDNVDFTKEIVDFAKSYNVCVEAELGKLSGIEDDLVVDEAEAYYTDPAQAVQFVKQTGIDTLAVAIGTAHGLYKGDPKLDINRLGEINNVVDIPLVLHGASGLSVDVVQNTIELGICKVNIATELKMAFAAGLVEHFNQNPSANDPRKYFKEGISKMKEIVKQKILMCKSNNRF